MALHVTCPICNKRKHIYRDGQRAFYCCGQTHIIAECSPTESKAAQQKTQRKEPEPEEVKKKLAEIDEQNHDVIEIIDGDK